MPKSERLFEMLEYVKEYPGLTVADLSKLCDVSERGIYRYINTLSRAGISIRFQDGGYRLQDDHHGIFSKADPEDLEALGILLSLGMEYCEDEQVVERGRRLMKLVEMNLPRRQKHRLDEIEVVPEGRVHVRRGGTITIGHSSKPSIINPILTSETISVNLMNLIFSSLVTFDESQRPVPNAAKGWKISEDGLVWTFFMRDDIKFHDGHPLTAHDVEFTYKAMMAPENMSPMAERLGLIDGIETEDDYVLKIFLKHPFAPLLHRLSRAIAPRHILENTDLRDNPFNHCPVGSGPFKLADWAEDGTITLDANRDYFHKGRPILDRLIFKAYPNRKAALRAISQDEMDIALDLAAPDLLFAVKSGAFRVYPSSDGLYYAIIFNLTDPIFSDIRVRKAMDYAIDRDSIIVNQLKGYSKICTGPFGVSSWAYNHDFQPVKHDIQKAGELLAQAGWTDADDDGVLDRDGKPFEISIAVPEISDSLERVAVAIKAQLMKAGIKVNLVYVDAPDSDDTTFQAILVKDATGADPDYVYRSWHSEGGKTNLASYKNGLVDDLLEQGRQTTDMEERKAIYHRVHKIIHDDYPAIFLASACEFIGSNYRFRNVVFPSIMHFLTSMKDWQIIGVVKEGTIRKDHRKADTGT